MSNGNSSLSCCQHISSYLSTIGTCLWVVLSIVKKRRSARTSRSELNFYLTWSLQTERTTALRTSPLCDTSTLCESKPSSTQMSLFWSQNYQLRISASWLRSRKDLCFGPILLTLQSLEFVIHARSFDLNDAHFIQFWMSPVTNIPSYTSCPPENVSFIL